MGWFATLVVGLIAGFLAHLILRTKTSLIIDLVMGIAGGFLGGWLSSLVLGNNLMSGINIISIAVALVGAIILILIVRLITHRR